MRILTKKIIPRDKSDTQNTLGITDFYLRIKKVEYIL